MDNSYAEIVEALQKAYEVLPEGVSLTKGGLGELALAHELDHELVAGDKGADAVDHNGLLYEYKVSEKENYNFHHGTRLPTWEETAERISKHWIDIEGAWIAHRSGMKITKKAYVPTRILLPALLKHFENAKGSQLNKQFTFKNFEALNNDV